MRDEFAKKVKRKHAALQDIRDVVEAKLQQMLGRNPLMNMSSSNCCSKTISAEPTVKNSSRQVAPGFASGITPAYARMDAEFPNTSRG
jgi:hypothetical protein